MGTGEIIALAILLVGYLLYAHGPEKDGPLKRPDKRAARQVRRLLKMMGKALPALTVGAVFGLAAAGADARTAASACLLIWVGGAVFADTMNRPFGKNPRLDSILVGLGLVAIGVAAVL